MTKAERKKQIKALDALRKKLEVSMDVAMGLTEYGLAERHLEVIKTIDQKIQAHQRILDSE